MLSLWRTTVGKKMVMAITGLILFAFVLVHMLGNLKIYQGAEKYNAYGSFLKEVGGPVLPHSSFLWLARAALLLSAALHIIAAVELWLLSKASRPIPYSRTDRIAAGYATFTMRWGGVIVGLFVIYHLLHFTFGVTGYGQARFSPEDIYRNVINGFSLWYVSAFYIAAMGALGLHLYHGVWSLFQTLGLTSPRSDLPLKALSIASAGIVFCANISFPIAVLMGVLK